MKTITIAVIGVLIAGSGILAFAQQDKQTQKKAPTMAMCQQMKADMDRNMEVTMEADAKLEGLVTIMEEAPAANKANATAAVVSELVAQRKMMRSMKQNMDSMMMGHMMQHMGAGKMMDCPMMKGKMGSGGG